MDETNEAKNILSDLALERVMRDVLADIWEISPNRPAQATAQATSSHCNASDELENS
jgi:hypothetical protein